MCSTRGEKKKKEKKEILLQSAKSVTFVNFGVL
jgi:hypothetical protein